MGGGELGVREQERDAESEEESHLILEQVKKIGLGPRSQMSEVNFYGVLPLWASKVAILEVGLRRVFRGE